MVRDLVGRLLANLSYGRLLGSVAAVFIWGLGVVAALNQMGIATAVTTPVLITVLATLGGVVVVGMGGGLIRPMQQRWETWIGRFENELPGRQAYERGREDVRRAGSVPTETAAAENRTQAEPGTARPVR